MICLVAFAGVYSFLTGLSPDLRKERSHEDRAGASSAASFVSCKDENEQDEGQENKEVIKEEDTSSLAFPRPAPNFATFKDWLTSLSKVRYNYGKLEIGISIGNFQLD